MIHCICNNINTAKIDEAVSKGALCAQEIQAQCGTQFNCGQCRESINARIALLQKQESVTNTMAAE